MLVVAISCPLEVGADPASTGELAVPSARSQTSPVLVVLKPEGLGLGAYVLTCTCTAQPQRAAA